MINYLEIFIYNLKSAMKSQKITQAELAAKADISNSAMHLITTGNYNPSIDVISRLSNALGIPLPYLLTDNNNPDSFAKDLPNDLVQISVILSKTRAFQVMQWHNETVSKIKRHRHSYKTKKNINLQQS